jgi:hypothetical protein
VISRTFRYNCGNITKFDPSNTGHHIECKVKPIETPTGVCYITTVFVGPYYSLEDAQEDMVFLQQNMEGKKSYN